jgi:hypothetical protein
MRRPRLPDAAQPDAAFGRLRPLLPPALLAGLLTLAVLGMAYFSFHANRRDALRLTDETLALLQDRITTEVTNYLSVPERALQILAEFAGQRAIAPHERPAAVESATALLRVAPMLALVGFADADGGWLMVRRDPTSGALETKTIALESGMRRAFWTRIAGPEAPPMEEDDPADRFDPRTRPWFRAAQASEGLIWTDLYVFFTDRQPGVTAARALPDPTRPGVVMADVRLANLSEFLSRLTVGRTGRALILDREGRLVALGDPARTVEVRGEMLEPARLAQLNDPVLSRAFDLYRAEGPGRRMVEVGKDRFIMLASRLPGEGRDWSLLMVVPEDDFVGFVSRNSLMVLAMALGVAVLAVLLAALAVRQALRATAARQAARAQAASLAAQSEAYAELAAARDVPSVLAVLARVLGARRVGLWRFDPSRTALACETQVDAATGAHAAGLRLRRAEAPKLFAALEAGQVLQVADAAADPRTTELHRLYLRAVGTRTLLSVPLATHAEAPAQGALWIEDAGAVGAANGLVPFARAATALLARAQSPPAPVTAAASTPGAARARGEALLARLRQRAGTSPMPAEAELFPRLAVLVLTFSDDAAIVAARCADGTSLLGRIRAIVRDASEAGGISCVRALGERVLLADGFAGDAEEAAQRLADLALAIQDQLTDAFTQAELGLDFRMGLDLGPAAGMRDLRLTAEAPDDKAAWNIFGEAVGAAQSLADSAPPGAIQVSESAHAALAADFLLRARGRFFIPETGEIGTWLVAGHA